MQKTHKILAAAALSIAVVAPHVAPAQEAAAAPTITISMATLAPAGSTWMTNFEAANRELRRRTSNRISVRWFAGGVQGDEAEVIRKIRAGRLDGAAVTAVGLGQIHQPILAFQIPGMFANNAKFIQARDALRPVIDQAFNAQGFTMLGFGTTGNPRLMSKNEVRTPTQLRSAHPWQWSDDRILPQVFAQAGATGVRLGVPEVLGALSTNRIDTLIASPLAAVSLQWSTHFRFMGPPGRTSSLGALVIATRKVNSIPEADRTIIAEVFRQYDALLSRAVAAADDRAATTMTTRGVTAMTLTPAEQTEWTNLFTATRPRFAGQTGDAAWIARVEAAGR